MEMRNGKSSLLPIREKNIALPNWDVVDAAFQGEMGLR